MGNPSGKEPFHFISLFWTITSLIFLGLGGILWSEMPCAAQCGFFSPKARDPNGELHFNRFQPFDISFEDTWELRMQAQFLIALDYSNTEELQLGNHILFIIQIIYTKLSSLTLQYFMECAIHRCLHKPESWRKAIGSISFNRHSLQTSNPSNITVHLS